MSGDNCLHCKPGLSPRVRGNRRRRWRGVGLIGSIPACAGEPPRSRPWLTGRRVYPRVCGGTTGATVYQVDGPGLSPRVRGNLAALDLAIGRDGSIPACAGEPRGGWKPMLAATGLSPRVRGNPRPPNGGGRPAGSIPACAGEPLGRRRLSILPRVYPRVCGGTLEFSGVSELISGLSPRVRGNHADERRRWRVGGSIPACAGEPWAGPALRWSLWVYPRVCGGTPGCWRR